jgi:predicted DsbA family dithiol-disulfide isomerase
VVEVAVEIEVFADVWCPFAYVGLRRLFELRGAAGRSDVAIRVRAWPLELVNGEPMPAAKAAASAAALRAQVVPSLFADVDEDSFPTTTLPALALVESAYAQSGAKGEAASLRLRELLFEEGRDISSAEVLSELAGALGIEPAPGAETAVLESLAEGRRRGVLGSPHFFCGELESFCPSLEISRDADGLVLVADAAKLTAFVERCLSEGQLSDAG